MKTVFVCSPYRGEVERNTQYARAAMLDCIRRGEAPFVPHLLYPQVLDDDHPDERNNGIEAGFVYLRATQLLVVYNDFGVTLGMNDEIYMAHELNIPVEYRRLPDFMAS